MLLSRSTLIVVSGFLRAIFDFRFALSQTYQKSPGHDIRKNRSDWAIIACKSLSFIIDTIVVVEQIQSTRIIDSV